MKTRTNTNIQDRYRMPSRLLAIAAATFLSAGFISNVVVAQPADEGTRTAEQNVDPSSDKYSESFSFEWGGVYELSEGVTDLVLQPGPDASIDIALVPVAGASGLAFDASANNAERVFSTQPKPIQSGDEILPGSQFYQLRVEEQGEMRFQVRVAQAGRYALFTQHFADEFQTTFVKDGLKVFPETTRNFVDRFGQIVIWPTAVKAFGVKIEQAELRTLIPSFSAPASVAYNTERMASIGSLVTGRVGSLSARQGDLVRKGDTLLVVESIELGESQSDYIQKNTMARAAVPIVEITRSAAERARKLHDESGGISLTEVQRRVADQQTAESALLNARGAVTAAYNRLQLLGMNENEIAELEKTGVITPQYTVRAPMSGRVISRDVTQGELVGPDRESLLVIADTSTVWVLADVPEMRLKDVAVGSSARITLAAFPDETFDGTVSFISNHLNESTRTADIRVVVDNTHGLLRPGMFARAEIIGTPIDSSGRRTKKNAPALAVPESAIQTIEGKSVVFVPFTEKPNTFLKRPVTVGESVGGMMPVIYGLREGESIVVAASFILKAELGKSTAKHAH